MNLHITLQIKFRSVTSTATDYNHVKDCLLLQHKSVWIIDLFYPNIDEENSQRTISPLKTIK